MDCQTGRHGDAWGHFDIIGRVRSWDGLIVLLRKPVRETPAWSWSKSCLMDSVQKNPEDRNLGTWIFRGYVHGNTFIGRWRETGTSANVVGFEGGFVVEKQP